jgi:hypothetical protein
MSDREDTVKVDVVEVIRLLSTRLDAAEKKAAKLDEIMELIMTHNCDGGHHKQWLLDQIVRVIQGDNYERWKFEFEYTDNEGGFLDPETDEKMYEWDEGIP